MPADPIVNDHYGDVLWKNGDKLQARYYWEYVLNLKKAEKDLKEKIQKTYQRPFRMVLKSHAKINLTLSVNKKLLSGLHDIQSMFCLINLFDNITIKRNNNSKFDKISFKGPHSKFVKNQTIL